MAAEVRIDSLGAGGDGVAVLPGGGRLYVPFTLSGETVLIEAEGERARLLNVLEPSPLRVQPPCRHFGECGGCALQHFDFAHYLEWKRQSVAQTLASRGIEAELSPIVPVPPYSRRRAVLGALFDGAKVSLGFHKAFSHELVDIAACIVLEPAIITALDPLRGYLARLLHRGREARVTVLRCSNGLDVDIRARHVSKHKAADAESVFAGAGIVRLTLNGEQVHQSERPLVHFGAVGVEPPPGAFLQAVEAVGDAMAREVISAAGRAKTALDLFSGLGAFSFPLAAGAAVTAVEGDDLAVQAVQAAIRAARGIKPVSVLRRDLLRVPFSAPELNRFDVVVFDPPRAGAVEQAREIAKSKIRCAVAVSCNPATFARDARILLDGGFSIERLVPFDQFLFTGHVEIVAVFRR